MPQTLIVETAPLTLGQSDLLVIYAAEGQAPGGVGGTVWTSAGLDWQAVLDGTGFKGKPGQALDFIAPSNVPARRMMVLGSGKPNGVDLTAWTDRGGSLMGKISGLKAETVSVVLDGADASPAAVAELAAGLRLRHYKFDKYKSQAADENGPATLKIVLHIADPAAAQAAIADRGAVAEGTLLARDLINEPANVLGPVEFAGIAGNLAEFGVEVETLMPEDLEKLGMRSLLAVARGSVRPARLVVMRWNGGAAGAQPVAFVGKGVVFDTGGISIKPAGSMEDMKGDMGGAAAVTGLMQALARRKARVNAVGVIGLVENMPDGDAARPGDIVRAMSGTTIEIVNTDAEGRLVLADALWYTQDRFKPRFMVNLATLTGAISVALGNDHAGLFSNNDELASRLLAAGLAVNEKLWRMPMGPAYDKLIESRFADIKNSAGRPASSITAAHFLSRFVNGVPWAHLDIAGTAFGAPATETNAGWAPGFGVALLDRLVRDNYEA
ncbi:leucyl aminopeptidase [Devosia nitrariae]|uniref:Probable cytosol aminopeptidase n=1 Tax=Devosia nitrariae TaxID=2071872 RepID=A0ABQ5W6G8_9HYPH|nr:leucyl aminopeptidase [Devosia nitrariae]GLQ55557.1 putative cytosol aminopeptidase [Devosia nitrariae]